MAKKENLTYEAAFAELNTIVGELEDAEVSVDKLAEKMKRASELITYCSDKLRSTEDAVNKIIRDMDDPGPASEDESKDEPF
ncbi:MAG: exodeoxyribonuclease VII small subunit [Flavobacteriales bacterium]|jgi:exodeoxyribonuclease VII small subunit